jgi:hypothetical protein
MGSRTYRTARTGLVLTTLLLPAACQTGTGAFQSDPFAGFPPTFTEAPYASYRAQFVTEHARFQADRPGFMRRSAAESCALSPEAQKRFAATAFIPQPQHMTPTWDQVRKGNAAIETPPIIDQAKVRVLEGSCDGDTIDGKATVHATFLVVARSDIGQAYNVSEVELLETCAYRDMARDGDCARHEAISKRLASIGADGTLVYDSAAPNETAVVFDYGAYADNREAAPGVTFGTSNINDIVKTNTTLSRHPAGDRIRYAEANGGAPAHTIFFRRAADGKLHGPVTSDGITMSCYENGTRVLRGGACEAK